VVHQEQILLAVEVAVLEQLVLMLLVVELETLTLEVMVELVFHHL
jgi:hypothetical protein